MNAEQLTILAGVLLSLILAYFPGLEAKYNGLDGKKQALIMLGLLLAVSIGVFAISCAGLEPLVACTQEGVWGLVGLFVTALVTNQATYLVAVKPFK